MEMFAGVLGVFAFFFLVLLAILWIVLPFAVFGVSKRLDKVLKEIQTTNAWLGAIDKTVTDRSKTPPS